MIYCAFKVTSCLNKRIIPYHLLIRRKDINCTSLRLTSHLRPLRHTIVAFLTCKKRLLKIISTTCVVRHSILNRRRCRHIPFLTLYKRCPIAIVAYKRMKARLHRHLILTCLRCKLILPSSTIRSLPISTHVMIVQVSRFERIICLLCLFGQQVTTLSVVANFSVFPTFLSVTLFPPSARSNPSTKCKEIDSGVQG